MTSLLTTVDIAELLRLGHRHVRETIIKRPDFPRPAVNLSQKMRRWDKAKVQAWIDAQAAKNAR